MHSLGWTGFPCLRELGPLPVWFGLGPAPIACLHVPPGSPLRQSARRPRRHSVVQASSSDWVAGRAVTADHIQRTTRRPAGGTTDELAAGGHRAQQPQSRPGAQRTKTVKKVASSVFLQVGGSVRVFEVLPHQQVPQVLALPSVSSQKERRSEGSSRRDR